MKTKNFFLFLITLIILSGCSGAKDALQGKKRSDTSDEFLIEKKNPLTKPPDYNELPVPISEENSYTENNEAGDIEILLKKNKTNSTTSEQKNNNLEQSIIEKISN
tara:strand:- start:204 stop:521 length:318 start_codon:yes stop_codon:yes gene_type:complete